MSEKSSSDKSTLSRLRHRAQKLGERALQEMMSTPQGAEAVGIAIKGMQEGKRRLDAQAVNLIGTLGLATQEDLQRVSHKVGQARKRLQDAA